MKITLKLYATLSDLLPNQAKFNAAEIEVPENTTPNWIIDHFRIPREKAHLVLINGVFVCGSDRDQSGKINLGDTLAIWPPIAGG
jgi:sulfur carrier protein ThiS